MKMRRRLGRIALVLTAALGVTRSTAYIRFTDLSPTEKLPGAIAAFSLPVTVWIVAWFAVAAAAAAGAVRVKTWGFYPTVAMCLMWCVGYLFAIPDLGTRTGPTAGLYFILAAFLVIIAIDIDRTPAAEDVIDDDQ